VKRYTKELSTGWSDGERRSVMSSQVPSVVLHLRTQQWSDGERRIAMSSQAPKEKRNEQPGLKCSATLKNSAME
jgi:hypothetical protein